MKKKLGTIMIVAATLVYARAFAQLSLPVPSPKASVKQTVGVTDIEIEYSRPAVKGRKVWGDLVPFGKVWRTGANSATAFKVSTDVEIGGKKIAKGEYAIFSIPAEKDWVIIINSNEGQKGSVDYKENLDLVRVNAKAEKSPEFKERLEFSIDLLSDDKAKVWMSWENVRVGFEVKTATTENAGKNIAEFAAKADGLWYDLAQSARYSFENNLNTDKQMLWIDQSIALKDHFFNKLIKARMLKAAGNNAEAYTYIAAAKEFGEKNPSGFYNVYKAEIEKMHSELSAFAPKASKKK